MSKLSVKPIFVFGSNLAGRHGRGAALYARKHHGAEYGVGIGRTGNSYAIPTKDANLKVLGVQSILGFVNEFKLYARAHPKLQFQVTKVGCGLAGYSESVIMPMFKDAPNNCIMPEGWEND